MRQGYRTAVLFAGVAALAAVLLLPYSAAVPMPVLEPLAAIVTQVTHAALNAMGIEALRSGSFLYVPAAFEYHIRPGCSGILPTVVFVVAVLVSPGSGRAKRWGLAVGIPLLLSLNVLRLVHLFYVGVHWPGRFMFAHTVLWEGTMVLSTFGLWLTWAWWATPVSHRRRAAVGREVVAGG